MKQQLSEQIMKQLLRINEDVSAVAMKKSCYQTSDVDTRSLIRCCQEEQLIKCETEAVGHTITESEDNNH
ncbi:hypothetical protein F511_42470 [Dorcoceras hygrometricum]|uniref:Uncharacterized protein n=1 Tax=Dorcoceras hygrometricum TaxID=472368 RepID=A0A2Z7DHK8_9LAMI|nr:hypothetical protein F511_42470 [Dorcoceras hygrometricum]